MTDNFDFEPKRVLKHKNHVTLNEGEQMQETVQHLKKQGDEFVELSKNEAARKYGSKKLVRELDFKSRDKLKVEDKGIGKTPDWFDYIIPTIDWEENRTFLYELDHLWLNMFFVRELYGEEGTGREQIIQLTKATQSLEDVKDKGQVEDQGLSMEVLCQLDYDTEKESFSSEEADGFIQVEIVKEEKEREDEEGAEYDVQVDFKQAFFEDDEQHLTSGLREILTGICLKHGYESQMVFKLERNGSELKADIKDKDFTVRFDSSEWLDEPISAWVFELFIQDGCPLNTETVEVEK